MEPLVVTHEFRARSEAVFDAWLDPEKVRKFLFATPEGEIVRCDLEAQVGGKFLITDRRGGDDVDHIGEYLAIERPNRLSFTFAVPKYSPLYTIVTIRTVPAANGCGLTLEHEGVPADWRDKTAEGWKQILNALDESLTEE